MEKIIQRGAEAEIILTDNKKYDKLKSSLLGGWVGGGKNEIKKNKLIIKRRVPKSYRIPELDEKIRRQRTKSETKLLEKASNIIFAPKVFEDNSVPMGQAGGNKENYEIKMPFIKGKKLSEYLDKFPLKKQKEICKNLGVSIAKLHDSNIIHGDLTTSNMIYVENKNKLPVRSRLQSSTLNNKLKINSVISKSSLGWVGGNKRASARENFKIFFIDFGLGFISSKTEDKAVDLHLLKQALESKHFRNWNKLFNSVILGYKISKDSNKVLTQFKKVEQRGRYKEKY